MQLKRDEDLRKLNNDPLTETATQPTGPGQNSNEPNNKHKSGHSEITYPITQVEFERVQTPFIIGIWILSASIAKIGNI